MFYHCGTGQQNGCDDNEPQLRPHASMVVFMMMFMMVPVVFVAVTFVCVMMLTHTSKLIGYVLMRVSLASIEILNRPFMAVSCSSVKRYWSDANELSSR